MDLDALLRPRGPLPPGVYWRRRLVLLLVLAVGTWLVARSIGGEPAAQRRPSPSPSPSPTRPSPTPSLTPSPTPSPTPRPSASPAPSPSPSRSPGGPCRPTELKLEATANARSYASGVRPVLTLAVTNTGPVACTRDVGQAARELRVRSGNDRIWSSDDCSPGGRAAVTMLQPGQRLTFSVTWSRRRSAPGCPADQPLAAAGTYQVIGRLGDLTAAGSAFTLG